MSQPRCVEYLRDYVALPSVNPMGREDVPESIAGERRVAEHLCAQLRRLGLDAETIGSGSRLSVVAEARAGAEADTVLVASHIDTVPVDGMEIDPFDPVVTGGRLYGRGSCDTKAGMAALIDALAVVLERGTLRRNLILVGEADEEFGSVGVEDALVYLDRAGARRPDWVLATEPTDLQVVHCHKGVASARLEAHGRACHASEPGRGRNAIMTLARATLALEALGAELESRSDPQLGPPTLSIGLTGGGHASNIVPDRAWLVADRRLVPGEDAQSFRVELEAALVQHGVSDVTVASCEVLKPPLGTPADHPAVRVCLAALGDDTEAPTPVGVAFGTDAGLFSERGIPGVVMGPGSIRQAHTAREFVPVAQVEAMARFFERLLTA